jgi:predicted chitinase
MISSTGMLGTLLLCGLMGLIGQGVRAAIGLKRAAALQSGTPTQQNEFNAAYFLVSMMIGFIAGILAGIGIGINQLVNIDPTDIKILLGIAVAGYAGADFIENAFSRIIPGLDAPQEKSAGGIQSLTAQVGTLASTVAILTKVTPTPVPPAAAAPIPATPDVALTAALKIVAPTVSTETWVPALITAFAKFDVNSNRRMAAAIGQFLVEAGAGFQELVENLNYTHASRIVQIYPNEFPTETAALPFVGNPEGLGNVAYANRLGNGDRNSGDGFRFRGRGLIQITGRDEYTELATILGMTPEQLSAYCETPAGAASTGCWYLSSRGCLPLADAWEISRITRKVNGAAMEGNDQRIAYSNAILKALGG